MGSLQAVVILGLLATMMFVFTPVIGKLNRMLKIGRGAVLLFPNDVINGVPRVRALVRGLTDQSR